MSRPSTTVSWRLPVWVVVATLVAGSFLSGCDGVGKKRHSMGKGSQGAEQKAKASPQLPGGPKRRIAPEDVAYVGAFQLPAEAGFERGGYALAYYPKGDPGGPADGFAGSLFITGSLQQSLVAEVTIPAPGRDRRASKLPAATKLQGFVDVRGRRYEGLTSSMRVVGMAYLPRQGPQKTDKLYFTWGQHHHDADYPDKGADASHMWCELDLGKLQAAGAWHIDNRLIYSVNDYLFTAPQDWAKQHVEGRSLITGRYLEGGWSGMGPSIHAIAPWQHGNPPPPKAKLDDTVLLQYASTLVDAEGGRMNDYTLVDAEGGRMNDYTHADDWDGGAWLTSKGKAAVVFVGTKAAGTKTWYGNSKRPCDPCPEDQHQPEKGWWSDRFEAQMVFYDVADLEGVAAGKVKPEAPQPYAKLNLDRNLLSRIHQPDFPHVSQPQQMDRIGAVAYDRSGHHLFVTEPFGDLLNEKPVIHVFEIQ